MSATSHNPNLESLYRPLWLTYGLVNLVTLGMFDIAVRDLAMAIGAYTLARLAEMRQEAPAMPAGAGAGVSAAGLRERRV